MTTDSTYLLGNTEPELRRLEEQAQMLAPPTRALMRLAGIEPGMRVLDLGTGAGDVAFTAAEIVGPTGSVVGIDQSADALSWAARRTEVRGVSNVSFIRGDLNAIELTEPVDAVVGRLVLLYTPDPARILRRYAALVRSGGVVLAMEYDMPTTRAVPGCPATDTAARWVIEAFGNSGLDPVLGPRLGRVLRTAGFADVGTIGIQPYLAPGAGAGMLAGIIRTLLPLIEQAGVATAAEVDIATLEARLATEMREHDAVMAYPTLVGAWAQTNRPGPEPPR